MRRRVITVGPEGSEPSAGIKTGIKQILKHVKKTEDVVKSTSSKFPNNIQL